MFRRKYFWEDRPSSSSEDEDSENEENLRIERRQYKMLPRIGLDRWDDRDFIYRFRLSKPTTLMVLSLIEDSLPCNEGRSRELRGITQLLIALRYYALGSIQLAVTDFIGVSIATVHRTLKRVSQAIANLAPRFFRMPETRMERLEAARNFYAIAKFPRTIGAIDCTHVRIQSPGGTDPELFRNRKGWFSLNVQTVAAADLKIIDIVARWQVCLLVQPTISEFSIYQIAEMLSATCVPSPTQSQAATAVVGNARSRLVQSYFQPMLGRQ
ncbi:putative nuclease HARBI1 isoform X2 [Episyrphus balteatus]|uniref:putative nuclease HARBI1 isoform X2 n=1 Tax=Episyrphus balteatus TaxID=286459 RepID=UPI002485AA1C|nr:putative nuclease HARBI1 isoform X2 [Episyrphus balteatus]